MGLPLRLYGERVEVHSKATVRPRQATAALLDRLAQSHPSASFFDKDSYYAFLPYTSRDGYTASIMVRTLDQYSRAREEMKRTGEHFELGKHPLGLAFPDRDLKRGEITIRFDGKPIYRIINVTLGTYRYEYDGVVPGPQATDYYIKEFNDNRDEIERTEIAVSDRFHKTQQELLAELGFRLSTKWANYYPKNRAPLMYPPESFEWLQHRLICWDLDDTLGKFKQAAEEAVGYRQSRVNKIRSGIKNVLGQLSERAFTHVVTTSGLKRYADLAVKRGGLSEHFKQVFAGGEVSLIGEKHYKPVTEMFGLSPEEAAARMVVIGDMTLDQPFDMSVLFIEDPNGIKRDAKVLWEILDAVDAEGDGNLAGGHKRLFERGAKEAANDDQGVKDVRRVDLESGVSFMLGYRAVHCTTHRGEVTRSPVILGIEAPVEYHREMEEVSA